MPKQKATPEPETPVLADTSGESPVVETAPSPPVANNPMVLRVVDPDGHILFCYNQMSRRIEIKTRGQLFEISIDLIRSTAARNLISEAPVFQVTASTVEG
jgi:hypothetical protein